MVTFQIEDKVVLLTGGAGILGRRMSEALLEHGARLVLADRNPDLLQEVMASLEPRWGGRIRSVMVDIADAKALRGLKSEIELAWGPVEVLINNAATKTKNIFEPFPTFPIEDWDEVMRVNVTGVMLACQVFGSCMAERGVGSIINTLSIYGIVGPDQRIYEGAEYMGQAINTPAVYSASKAAVWGLTKYLATYWGSRGVRVNAISPGGVFSGQNDAFVQRYSARVPLGRMGQANEMAGAVVYLASEASSYMTGQNLIVDGGLTVW